MLVKILSLLLSVTLLFFAAVPARASEDHATFNVLDYCTPNNSGNYIVSLSQSDTDISFDAPVDFMVYSIDILVYLYSSSGSYPTQVYFVTQGGYEYPLTITSIDQNLYRIQGNISGIWFTNVKLRFIHTGSLSVSFFSFRVSTFRKSVYPETGVAKLETYGYSPTINYNPSDEINGRTWESNIDNFISIRATITDWKLYDRLEFQFFLLCSDITSVCVMAGNQVLDADVSTVLNSEWVTKEFYITVSVDLKDLNLRTTDIPTVFIEAEGVSEASNTFTVISMAGVVYIDEVNSLSYFLQRIYFKLDDLVDPIVVKLDSVIAAIKGDTDAADDFNSESAEKNEQLQDMVGVMDSVQRPDINQLDPITQLNNSGADIAGGIGPVLTVPMQNPIILQVLILSLTFALVAYVLYGKR